MTILTCFSNVHVGLVSAAYHFLPALSISFWDLGKQLKQARILSFVLQTYLSLLWQIWTVLAGCGPFSFILCSMLTTLSIDCQGSEPSGETGQFLTGFYFYIVYELQQPRSLLDHVFEAALSQPGLPGLTMH